MKTLTADVVTSSEVVTAEVRDARPDSVQLFGPLTEAQQQQLATDAWQIGLRALANAFAQAQEANLKDVGGTLLAEFDRQLKTYVEAQQQTLARELGRFFDPKDGHVTLRMTQFVADGGGLARVLEKYLAPKNSVLAETLAKQVGESSALFKKLSPTDSEGLVKTLEAKLQDVLAKNHGALAAALDPLAEDGAVARFLKSLREELKGADEDRAKQLSTALAALNANDEDSLLSRLMRETNAAREALVLAVNPDAPNSPMGIIKDALTALLKDHARTQAELFALQSERQVRFEGEVREALGRFEGVRAANDNAPRGGVDFESAVLAFIGEVTGGSPCTLDACGNTSGLVPRCKTGDAVVRFTDESAFAGAGLVVEVKHDASYSPTAALAELDEARKNRDAGAGVFVMAQSHAPATFKRFARHGNNVLVVWDAADPATDPYLEAALLLGMALASRTERVADPGDLEALADIEARIEMELKRLASMEKHNTSIRKNSDDIADELRKGQKQLTKLLADARQTLKALNVELHDEAAERATPIEGAIRIQPLLSARSAQLEETPSSTGTQRPCEPI